MPSDELMTRIGLASLAMDDLAKHATQVAELSRALAAHRAGVADLHQPTWPSLLIVDGADSNNVLGRLPLDQVPPDLVPAMTVVLSYMFDVAQHAMTESHTHLQRTVATLYDEIVPEDQFDGRDPAQTFESAILHTPDHSDAEADS